MERAHKYEFEGKVRYSEIDHRATMTLPALINYFQDCSTFQSEELGIGVEYLKEKGRLWVLTSWQIRIFRYPSLGEEVRTGTWACGFHGFVGMRNFVMETVEGEMLACAYSEWAYMDPVAGRLSVRTQGKSNGTAWKSRWKWSTQAEKSLCPESRGFWIL